MGKFFAEEGIDYQPTGWITDTGQFIKCSPFKHDSIAEEKTGLTVQEVEKIWIRISVYRGKNHLQFCGDKINKRQHKALDSWGLNELLENKRITTSTEFIDAYFK